MITEDLSSENIILWDIDIYFSIKSNIICVIGDVSVMLFSVRV